VEVINKDTHINDRDFIVSLLAKNTHTNFCLILFLTIYIVKLRSVVNFHKTKIGLDWLT